MSGTTGANLPVRIEVQGTQQAEAQFNRVGQAGQAAMQRVTQSTNDASGSFRNFGYVAGQAGFQVQDFAVQVQSGTSAMTALAQQGSQFLGVFGTGGAVAGAVLTVGILAASLLSIGENSEEANRRAQQGFDGIRRASEDLKNIIKEVNDLFLTQEQRASAARTAVIQNLGARLAQQEDIARQFLEESASQVGEAERQLAAAQRRLEVAEREAANARRAGAMVPQDQLADANRAVFTAQARLDGLNADIGRQSRLLGEARAQRELLDRAGGDQGQGQFGPPAPTTPRPERIDETEVNAALADVRRLSADRERFIRDNETALDRYNRRIDEITALSQAARLNGNPIPEETIRRATDAALADFERMERATERTSQFANQLGFSFSSAFEDAIVKGKSFSEVLKGLEQDIARIIIRAAITQPLGNALAGGVNSIMGSFSFSNPFAGASGAGSGNTFPTVSGSGGTFAMGGIMTPDGPLPLNRYASGGIANSPQIALFGEGRTPEAYVPLPDGRRIPVAMQGGGGMTFAPTYNIDARGADASMVPRLRAEMVAIARASNAELLDSIQRGGSAARIVGRRA